MRFNSRSTYLFGNPKARQRAVKHYKRLAAGKVQHDEHVIAWMVHDAMIKRCNGRDERWQGVTYGHSPVHELVNQQDAHVIDWLGYRTTVLLDLLGKV